MPSLSRRALLTAAALPLLPRVARATEAPLTRAFPKSGFQVPAVGMGTWITFNVGADPALRAQRVDVLRAFFDGGGGMIDSSPMYGSSEEVVGHGLRALGHPPGLVSATKVWTSWGQDDIGEQMAASERLWGVDAFDLQQVHNLVDWEDHLETFRQAKAAGRIRHMGVTTSHGSRHEEVEHILRAVDDLDAVQLTYNIIDRAAEDRLLPLAADRGVAVVVNRPFRRKELFHRFAHAPLPAWAEAEAGATTWAAFFLKFILSHPAVTVAIPATTRVDHMRENMAALAGPLPDARTRRRMVDYVQGL